MEKTKYKNLLFGFLLPLLIILLWLIISNLEVIRNSLLPKPQDVIYELNKLIVDETLIPHLLITFKRVILGFIFGGLIATLFGVLTGISKNLRKLIDPTIQALKAVPSLAWVPLFILWFGIFEVS